MQYAASRARRAPSPDFQEAAGWQRLPQALCKLQRAPNVEPADAHRAPADREHSEARSALQRQRRMAQLTARRAQLGSHGARVDPRQLGPRHAIARDPPRLAASARPVPASRLRPRPLAGHVNAPPPPRQAPRAPPIPRGSPRMGARDPNRSGSPSRTHAHGFRVGTGGIAVPSVPGHRRRMAARRVPSGECWGVPGSSSAGRGSLVPRLTERLLWRF